jgi:exopolysaccharide biosynthesis polyprenyl glycosylphosphotransferase
MIKVISDILLLNISFILAYYFRFKILILIAPATVILFERYINILIFITLVWLSIFKLVGLYDQKKYTALIDELASLFLGITLSSLILLGMLFLYREWWFSRLVIANAWWISFLLLGASRILLFNLKRFSHFWGRGIRNTLVLGAGEMGQTLVNKMLQDQGLGYRVAGFLDDDPIKIGKHYHGVPVLGDLSQVKSNILKYMIVEVIIASTRIPAEKVLDIITECEKYGVEFKLVPGILELIASRVDVDELAGIPLLSVSEIRLKGLNAFIKRATDILLSATGIVALSPLLLVFAALVKLTSAGPVFFVQERIGREGKEFGMYKFRSMVKDADQLLTQIEHLSEVEGHLFKMKADPRMTPLGRFMRRFSIDELPQLFNVFLGDMSLVGPRPPLSREVVKYNSWHMKRLRARPGITGLWQVSGRSLLPFEDMVRLDIYYIENWSLWMDAKLLLRTIPVVLLGSGAY